MRHIHERTREGTAGKCAVEPLGLRQGVGVRADHTGSQNAMQRELFSRQNTIVQKSVQCAPGPGPAQRRGRGVSDGGRPPVGGRFRHPDRSLFFRLTPAFGLCSLRKNGYVLTGVDETGPPTGDRPRRWTAAGWRRAKSGESASARSALDKGTSAHARARGSCAAGPGEKRCPLGGEGGKKQRGRIGARM